MGMSIEEARRKGLIPKQTKDPTKKAVPAVSCAKWLMKIEQEGIWIQIPEIPPSQNVYMRWHWTKRKEYLDRISTAIGWLARATRAIKTEKATVRITYYFPSNRYRDYDNYNGKFLLDALRHAGILIEDNHTVIDLPQPVFKVDKNSPRVEILVEAKG